MAPNYSSKRGATRRRFVPGPSYTSGRMHSVHGALGLVRLSPFSPPKSSKLGRKVTLFGLFHICGAELLFETRRDTSEICSRPFLYIRANAFRTWGSGFGPFESFLTTKIFEIRAKIHQIWTISCLWGRITHRNETRLVGDLFQALPILQGECISYMRLWVWSV